MKIDRRANTSEIFCFFSILIGFKLSRDFKTYI